MDFDGSPVKLIKNRSEWFQKHAETIIIMLLWILVFFQPLIFFTFQEEIVWDVIFRVWYKSIPFLVLFLVNHFILIPYLLLKNKTKGFFTIVLLLSLLLAVQNSVNLQGERIREPIFGPLFPGPGEPRQMPGRPEALDPELIPSEMPDLANRLQRKPPEIGFLRIPIFLNTLILSILVIGFDTGLRVSIKWFQSEKEKSLLEKESVKNELAFLRNQVNPHFFMNTLNNIHSLIDIDTEQARDAVIRLSKLMRHLIYDSDSDTIALKKELEFIKSYVALMKLRLAERVEVLVHLPEQVPDKNIPPLLFTSLLENAFIHGVSYKKASFIHISIEIKPVELVFKIINSNHQELKPKLSGIGIENTRKRLKLLYRNAFRMDISESEDVYEVELKIPI